YKIPKRSIDRIILRRASTVRKLVRKHSLIYIFCKGLQDRTGDLFSSRNKGKTGKADHRIPSPIGKPVIAGNDRCAIGKFLERAVYDKLIRCVQKLLDPKGRILFQDFSPFQEGVLVGNPSL